MSDDTNRRDVRPLVRHADHPSDVGDAGGTTGDSRLRDLSALTGLQRLNLLRGQLAPGDSPCRLPVSNRDEVFLQIVAGNGELECDGQRVSLAAGDFLSLRHPDGVPTLHNRGEEPLLWLFGSR